ncbi:MAG: hypothetical protein ACKPKO_38980, partial [Candidatus Fonsibacter sp.]
GNANQRQRRKAISISRSPCLKLETRTIGVELLRVVADKWKKYMSEQHVFSLSTAFIVACGMLLG